MLKAYCVFKELEPKAIQILEKAGILLEFNKASKRPNQQELKKLIEQYDIIIIGIEEIIMPDMLEVVHSHKIIATISIGLDHIAECFFDNKLITVINSPKANVISVAEHIYTLIFALNKRIIEASSIRQQLKQRPKEIQNSTLGLIGAGKISKEVIKIAKAFQLKIYCHTLNEKQHSDLIQEGVTFTDLKTLLSISDIISINIPLTKQSKNLISKDEINLLKKDATFINTSRAEIVDMKELIKYADENETFQVGLDIDTEKYEEILNRPRNNVIVTPHIAGITTQAVKRMDIEVAENIVEYLNRRRIK